MREATVGMTLVLSVCLCPIARGQAGRTTEADAPLYRISFERGEAISGISATPVIQSPFECASDGTIFVSFVSTGPVGAGLPPPPPVPPPTLLTSISRAGRGQSFRLDQVPDLHVSSEVNHFASGSNVVFLVKASRENKPVKRSYSVGSYHGEFTTNAAEQKFYIVVFSKDAEYLRAIEIGEPFQIEQLGMFPSGTFLAFGFDGKDHSPKLVMLTQNGEFLKSLTISRDDAPASMISGKDGHIELSQLVPSGHEITVVQNESSYPLLEIGEGGVVRAIHAKLPKGEQVQFLIPSDRNLYVVGPETLNGSGTQKLIYEVDPENGTVLRRFATGDGVAGPDAVACVSDGKFLSIDYGNDKVVPLIGTAEPASSANERKR